MLDPGSKFNVKYRNDTKTLECVVLAGRQFGKLVQILNNLNHVPDDDQSVMFEEYIPSALSLVVGSEDVADDLWSNKLTMQDVMEIVQKAVAQHSVDGESAKKSE